MAFSLIGLHQITLIFQFLSFFCCIDMKIIAEILIKAEEKYKKEKKTNPNTEFDVLNILSSYHNVLKNHCKIQKKKEKLYILFFNG